MSSLFAFILKIKKLSNDARVSNMRHLGTMQGKERSKKKKLLMLHDYIMQEAFLVVCCRSEKKDGAGNSSILQKIHLIICDTKEFNQSGNK